MSSTTEGSAPSQPDPSSALKVAIMFVKQYYKCLSSSPDMLEQFYSPPSTAHHYSTYLSHGEGSESTAPSSPFESTHHGHDRWGCSASAGEKMLFEFDDGAIDAQPSQNEGILMVVTASVIFPSSTGGAERRKKFVQTFFLAKIGRNFAVINDILRFLAVAEVVVVKAAAAAVEPKPMSAKINDESSTNPSKPLEAAAAAAVVEKKTTAATTDPKVAKKSETVKKKAVVESATAATSAEDESSAPGGGVEESKEEAPDEEEATAAATAKAKAKAATDAKKRSTSKENKAKKNKGGGNKQQQSQSQPPASKPAPGSWASLVVSGGSAPNTPSRTQDKKVVSKAMPSSAKQPPLPPSDGKEAASVPKDKRDGSEAHKKSQEKDKANSTTTNNSNSTKSNANTNSKNDNTKSNSHKTKDKERTKRDPDNTLVIKNLSESVKEQDILNMFKPFATLTKSKIVGTNLNHHRLLAFVDYDSVAPVMAALKKHKETPFEFNGKVLEVDQKTLEQRARRKAGGNNNSNHSNSNGYRNANAGAGRGGANKYNNNNNGGRGDGGNERGGRRNKTRAGQ